MREFNLEQAKKGKPLCTRDGHKARIVCFDAKGTDHPILALIEDRGLETAFSFTVEGKFINTHSNYVYDLFMATERHEGWINIYETHNGNRVIAGPYETEKDAVRARFENGVTIKIEWED